MPGEEGPTIGRNDQLCRPLAAAIGVVTAHRVGLAIRPDPFTVLVAFVAGHAHDRANPGYQPGGFEHMHRTHHVRRIGSDRVIIGMPDQRLRGEMENDLRTGCLNHRPHHGRVPHIALDVRHTRRHARRREQARIGGRSQGQPRHVGPERLQPEAEPTPLEAGMARDENAAALPDVVHQRFHGALPAFHRSSR